MIIVHALCAGKPLCGFTPAIPRDWPEGHQWDYWWSSSVNCPDCLAKGGGPRYEIIENGKAIKCRLCGRVSHNLNDVKNLYCGSCHVFLGG